jgi:hypothetical protein
MAAKEILFPKTMIHSKGTFVRLRFPTRARALLSICPGIIRRETAMVFMSAKT